MQTSPNENKKKNKPRQIHKIDNILGIKIKFKKSTYLSYIECVIEVVLTPTYTFCLCVPEQMLLSCLWQQQLLLLMLLIYLFE